MSHVGNMIQDKTDYNSRLAEYLGHVVDGDEGPAYHNHLFHPFWGGSDVDRDEDDATDDEDESEEDEFDRD